MYMNSRRTVNKNNYENIYKDYLSGNFKLSEICEKYKLKSTQTIYNIKKIMEDGNKNIQRKPIYKKEISIPLSSNNKLSKDEIYSDVLWYGSSSNKSEPLKETQDDINIHKKVRKRGRSLEEKLAERNLSKIIV